MNNFPAMTEEQREYLNQRLRTRIRSLEISERKGHIGDAQQDTLNIYRIAIAALTAEPVHQFIVNNPDNDGYAEWADCNPDYFSKEPCDMRRVLYTTPPAPVLRVPDGWIKCSERMPLELSDEHISEVEVIVTDGTTVGTCEYRRGYIPRPWAEWSNYGDIDADKISHWQPLPKPPEDSNEQ